MQGLGVINKQIAPAYLYYDTTGILQIYAGMLSSMPE
jgi:hypothetical protein